MALAGLASIRGRVVAVIALGPEGPNSCSREHLFSCFRPIVWLDSQAIPGTHIIVALIVPAKLVG